MVILHAWCSPFIGSQIRLNRAITHVPGVPKEPRTSFRGQDDDTHHNEKEMKPPAQGTQPRKGQSQDSDEVRLTPDTHPWPPLALVY